VRGRLDDAPLIPSAAHDQELDIPELRMVVPAYLDEKGIQVDMNDASHDCSLHQENGGRFGGDHDDIPAGKSRERWSLDSASG
jgi:hypothetical protein